MILHGLLESEVPECCF